MKSLGYHFRILIHLLPIRTALLAVCLLAVSCSNEEMVSPDTNQVQIQIHATTPIFAQQTPAESEVAQLQALVFVYNGSEYIFAYIAQATGISNVGNNYTDFTLNVFTESNPVKIYIIANADDALTNSAPQVGETENVLKQRINRTFTLGGITEDFPMWGEYLLSDGISSSLSNTEVGLKMLRAIARIDVTTDDVSSVFTMTSIQAFRANNLIRIVPDSYTTNPLMVSTPTVSASSSATINTNPISVTGNASESQLYLPEAIAPPAANQMSNATCVIVGGRYNGSADITYYRLDFAPPIAGYPLGQILRNHHYTFNITNITSPGWPTPEEAANNIASNIAVEVVDWADRSIYINVGGTNFFILSSINIILEGEASSNGSVRVSTDIPDYTLQWGDADGNPTGDRAESLNNGVFSVVKTETDIEVEALTANPSGSGVREQYIVVAAGRLHIPIKITQEEI